MLPRTLDALAPGSARTPRAWIGATLALLAACGSATQQVESARPAPIDRSAEAALSDGVHAERAQKTVRELVALGSRMGGTRSGDRAAAYLESAFRDAGLDVRVLEDAESWCHEERSWSVRAHRVGSEDEPRAIASAWPWGFSPSARGKARLATRAGDGLALIAEHDSKPQRGTALVLVDGETTLDGAFPVVGHMSEGTEAACPVFGVSRADGALLRGWLDSGAEVELEFELDAEIRKGRPRTVVARLPARGEKDLAPGEAWSADHLLFCAHGDSDSGGPGADDNASGVATLLEIARAWSAAVRDGRAPAPAREVRFAVWGTEIRSSREYLERRDGPEGRVLAVINYDQAGFGSGADQINLEPDDLPANGSLLRAFLDVLDEHRAPLDAPPGAFPARWATNKSLGGTDSYVFSRSERFRGELRPALTLFASAWGKPEEHPRTQGMRGESWSDRSLVRVDYDLYYHSAGDTPERTTELEPWNMAWCARVGMLGAARWLEHSK